MQGIFLKIAYNVSKYASAMSDCCSAKLQGAQPRDELLKCCILAQEDTMTRRNKYYFYQELECGRTFQNKLLMTAEFWPQK